MNFRCRNLKELISLNVIDCDDRCNNGGNIKRPEEDAEDLRGETFAARDEDKFSELQDMTNS